MGQSILEATIPLKARFERAPFIHPDRHLIRISGGVTSIVIEYFEQNGRNF